MSRHDGPELLAWGWSAGRAKALTGYRVPLTLTVRGGLHYLQGNTSPYFSVEAAYHRKGFESQCDGSLGLDVLAGMFGGRFADLVALAGADASGAPMHAEANGWYWLAGALGGLGERFHGGSGEWGKTPSECLEVFAGLVRLYPDLASAMAGVIQLRASASGPAAARVVWGEMVEAMRPRWKAEADAAIARHGLVVYGDPWPGAEPAEEG